MSNEREVTTPGGIIMPNPDYVEPPPPEPATEEEVAVAKAITENFAGILLPVFPHRDNPHIKRAMRFMDSLRQKGFTVVKDTEA